MIELRNVSAGYGRRPVIREISVRFEPGSVTAVIGPNGCGKSSLLRTASGQLRPLSGEVLADGRDLSALRRRELAKKVSFLPQSHPPVSLPVRTLVMHGRFPYLGFPRRPSPGDEAVVREAMRLTGVLEYRDRDLGELSGGERQKAYLAMAVAQEAETIFLDEPTTYLDIGYQFEILSLMKKLSAERRAVVAVMHDLQQAFSVADTICLMDHGSVEDFGAPDEVFAGRKVDRIFSVSSRLCSEGRRFLFFPRKNAGADARRPVK